MPIPNVIENIFSFKKFFSLEPLAVVDEHKKRIVELRGVGAELHPAGK